MFKSKNYFENSCNTHLRHSKTVQRVLRDHTRVDYGRINEICHQAIKKDDVCLCYVYLIVGVTGTLIELSFRGARKILNLNDSIVYLLGNAKKLRFKEGSLDFSTSEMK